MRGGGTLTLGATIYAFLRVQFVKHIVLTPPINLSYCDRFSSFWTKELLRHRFRGFRFVCFFREWGQVVFNQHFKLIALALGTSPQTKMFSFWHCPKRGGSCPNLGVLFQGVHFWSIKGVYFFQNANNLNFELVFRLFIWGIFSPQFIFKFCTLKMCLHDCVWGLVCVCTSVCVCVCPCVYVCVCVMCASTIKTVQMVQPRHSSSSLTKRARCTGAGCLKNGPRKVGEICST